MQIDKLTYMVIGAAIKVHRHFGAGFTEEIYKKLLFGKLEINEGMIFENIVSQMLVATGRKLYFYSKSDNNDTSSRMEIDFLITKNRGTSRHNIQPIEVKSSKRYTFSSLEKFKKKYAEYIDIIFNVQGNRCETCASTSP
jgi:predicted AAA+ superfamily ATPase